MNIFLPMGVLCLGWLLASCIGTYAYFANEQKF